MSNITVVDLNASLDPSDAIEKQEEPNVIENPSENQTELTEAPKIKKSQDPLVKRKLKNQLLNQ